jgi:hypothetical protein
MLKGEVITAVYKSIENISKKSCRIIADYDAGNKIACKEIGICLTKKDTVVIAAATSAPLLPDEVQVAEKKEEYIQEQPEEALGKTEDNNQPPTDLIPLQLLQ